MSGVIFERNVKIPLRASRTPYSSVVGGGLRLEDFNGRPKFMVMFIGTTEGITKEEDAALSEQIAAFINERTVYVPERE